MVHLLNNFNLARVQTKSEKFGRVLADYASNPIKLCSVRVTSLVYLSMFYGDKNDYAL